jgi:hypothetical protein
MTKFQTSGIDILLGAVRLSTLYHYANAIARRLQPNNPQLDVVTLSRRRKRAVRRNLRIVRQKMNEYSVLHPR